MQEPQLYEYAVIRIVPHVEREEFMNAGIILFCKKTGYINCKTWLNETKLCCMTKEADLDIIKENLKAYQDIALGKTESEPSIATLDAASRFRWLTAVRSTVIQSSKVHPGLSTNMEETLHTLFRQLVE